MVDFRPALLDADDALFNLGRRAVAHGVAHGATAHVDASLVPKAVLVFKQGHQAVHRELAEEVGTPGGVAADAGLGDAHFLRLGDDAGPAFHLLHLTAVGVAAGEHVAQVAGQARVSVPLDGQRRRVGAGALHAAGVQGQGGIGYAGLGRELGDDLVNPLHLGRPPGADKGTDDDALQAGFREHVEELNLVVNADVGVLNLHAFTHAFFLIVNCGPFVWHG